jgi:hypothetical protein
LGKENAIFCDRLKRALRCIAVGTLAPALNTNGAMPVSASRSV